MDKKKLSEKLRYKFDNLMSKGTIILVGMLFLVTSAIIAVTGAVAFMIGKSESIGGSIWLSIMHVLDAGTITGADTSSVAFIILMSIVTLCGIFITSILIGIITTGFEEKLNSLRKGNSSVIEKNHTVILGFNDSIYTMISELIIANENQKKACIVVLAEQDKETVETAIAEQIGDFKTTKIICRTGNITDFNMLGKCSIETCRSIIINEQNDFITTKAILAINGYLKTQKDNNPTAHIVATISNKLNYDAAKIAGEGNVELILAQDAISRIIAQTCRQPGLSNVLMELFDYEGNELYFENFPELAKKSFGDILNYFEDATVFGYKRNGEVYLNPNKDIIVESNDQLLLLVEDNGLAKPLKELPMLNNLEAIKSNQPEENIPKNILILGTNDMLGQILSELDNYFAKGSCITIADDTIAQEYTNSEIQLKNIQIESVVCDTKDRINLNSLTQKDVNHMLLLSSDTRDAETSDAIMLLKLIHLRDIAQKENKIFNITSEMKRVENQKLAKIAEVNDFVIGSNIINLILTQISENRDLATVFQNLLDADGSEIYIKKASHYVKLNQKINFYAVTEIAKQHNDIAIGYKKQMGKTFEIITNPSKSKEIMFGEDDYIIVLSAE